MSCVSWFATHSSVATIWVFIMGLHCADVHQYTALSLYLFVMAIYAIFAVSAVPALLFHHQEKTLHGLQEATGDHVIDS